MSHSAVTTTRAADDEKYPVGREVAASELDLPASAAGRSIGCATGPQT